MVALMAILAKNLATADVSAQPHLNSDHSLQDVSKVAVTCFCLISEMRRVSTQVDKDLREMLIMPDAPAPQKIGIRIWQKAIPQFNVGHTDIIQAHSFCIGPLSNHHVLDNQGGISYLKLQAVRHFVA